MNKTINFLSISICLSAILNANESAKITKEFQTPSKIQSAKLKQVSVIGKIDSEIRPFSQTGAVSSRAIFDKQQGLDSIIRSVPGAYTQIDNSQGTISTNIRGMSGFGRVDTKIDGVTQTFFGTSTASTKFHQNPYSSSSSTNAFGAMIDQNFLTSVDIERGSSSSNGNALMGGANFRTIDVDDIVAHDEIWGGLTKFSYGTNGIGPSFMNSVAAHFAPENSEQKFGALYGYSFHKKTQNYKRGDKKSTNDPLHPNLDDEYVSQIDDQARLTQKPNSHLFKLEYSPNSANAMKAQYRKFDNTIGGRKMLSDTYQYEYEFNPDANLIDIKFLSSYNTSKQNFTNDEESIAGKSIKDILKGGDLNTKNRALTLELSNTARFESGEFSFEQTVGINFLDNKYMSSFNEKEFFKDNENNGAWAFAPSGRSKSMTFYLNSTLSYDIFTLGIDLNRAQVTLNGYKPECFNRKNCFPNRGLDINKKFSLNNGKISFSTKFDELFEPFISYAVTSRAPNVQEMFFASDGGDSVNPFLHPEHAKTREIGFNSLKNGLFSDSDMFGFKITYYQSKIRDFIYNRRFYIALQDPDNTITHYLSVNSPKSTKFSGTEMEIYYDNGGFFAKSAFTKQKTDQITNETSSGYGGSFGYTQIQELPKYYGNVELGGRFLDEKITLGMNAKFSGPSYRVSLNDDDRKGKTGTKEDYISELNKEKLPKIPTIYDAYATIKVRPNFTIRAEIQNVFNKNYIETLDALNGSQSKKGYDEKSDSYTYAFDNYARGRTFYLGFEYKY